MQPRQALMAKRFETAKTHTHIATLVERHSRFTMLV